MCVDLKSGFDLLESKGPAQETISSEVAPRHANAIAMEGFERFAWKGILRAKGRNARK